MTPSPRPSGWFDVLACTVAVLAVPVLVWWAVGDLSSVGADLDYIVRPPALDPRLAVSAVVMAAVAILTAMLVLVRRGGAVRSDRRWWLVITPLLAVAAGLGLAGRVFTAGGYGANIGAGLFLILGVPLLVVVLGWCLAWSVYLRTRGSGARRPS